jgi:Co/Zn/Cd efflux system component
MVCFQTKSPNLRKFWRALECKQLVFSLAIYGLLVNFLSIWKFSGNLEHFLSFGTLNKKNLATLLNFEFTAITPE